MLTRRVLRIKVMQSLFAWKVNGEVEAEKQYFRRNLIDETERIRTFFIGSIRLLLAFVDLAAADEKKSHKNLLANPWVKALRESDGVGKGIGRPDWADPLNQNLVRSWFREIIRPDAEYKSYQELESPSDADHKAFLTHFFRRIAFGKTAINDFLAENSLRWAEDRDIVKNLIDKMIKGFDPVSGNTMEIPSLTLDWDDDKDFMDRLFAGAAQLTPELKGVIAQHTRNWEVERLPLTDRVILELAIAELITFPNIPVKVSINEYIELAKHYSTPKSWQFINGILDVIAKELVGKGVISKSGRGLIDNK